MGKNRVIKVIDSLRKAINELERINYPIGKLRSVYAELYVANKLAKFSPQIGAEREDKSADIYLAKIGKRVEVKSSEKGQMCDPALWC